MHHLWWLAFKRKKAWYISFWPRSPVTSIRPGRHLSGDKLPSAAWNRNVSQRTSSHRTTKSLGVHLVGGIIHLNEGQKIISATAQGAWPIRISCPSSGISDGRNGLKLR